MHQIYFYWHYSQGFWSLIFLKLSQLFAEFSKFLYTIHANYYRLWKRRVKTCLKNFMSRIPLIQFSILISRTWDEENLYNLKLTQEYCWKILNIYHFKNINCLQIFLTKKIKFGCDCIAHFFSCRYFPVCRC